MPETRPLPNFTAGHVAWWRGAAEIARRVLGQGEVGRALEELEIPKAAERKGARTDLQPGGKLPPSTGPTGKTRDIVGSAVGMSGHPSTRTPSA